MPTDASSGRYDGQRQTTSGPDNTRSEHCEFWHASTLKTCPHGGEDRLLADMVQAYPGDAYLADAFLSGLHGRELELLTRLVSDRTWMARRHLAANRLLQGLASCIIAEQNTSRIIDLFSLLKERPSDVAQLLVEGASQGITGARIGHLELPAAPKALLALLRDEAPVSLRTAAARLERFVFWPDKAGAEPLPRPLTVEESRLFEQGRTLYNMTCAACHQGDGGGLELEQEK